MNKTLVLGMVALSVVVGMSVAKAEDQSSGCGLGWMILKKNSLVSSSLRQTTNVFALNTIAMTSGTSGCAKHDIVLKEKAAQYFAEANYQKLQFEMAEGKGEHLESFAKILGCHDQVASNAGLVFQKNYSQIFSTDTVAPQQMLIEAARSLSTSDVARSCGFSS